MKRPIIVCLIAIATIFCPWKLAMAQAPRPDGALLVILIRDALTALNQANWTGNYTVLRDYASPSFSRANDPVRLTAIFQPIRAEGLNLAPVLFLEPKISKAQLSPDGQKLYLQGYFDSRPKQIHFDLSFEPVANRWRLFGLGVRSVNAASLQTNQVQTNQVQSTSKKPVVLPPVILPPVAKPNPRPPKKSP